MTRHITDSANRHPDGAPLEAFAKVARREASRPHVAVQTLHQRPRASGPQRMLRFLQIERNPDG